MRVPARLPLVQYWHEKSPPDYIVELLDSFATQNPEMEHLVFNDVTAEEFIAAHYGSRELAAFRACAVPAMRADYFRYCACHTLGGFCVDADYRCVGPLLSAIGKGMEGRLFQADLVLVNSMFGFRSPLHPLLDLSREVSTRLIERRFEAKVGEVTGPGIFSGMYLLFQARSIDEFMRYIEDGIEPMSSTPGELARLRRLRKLAPPPRLGQLFRTILEVAAGDRLAGAFEGIGISSYDQTIHEWVRHPRVEMAYKQSEVNWRIAGMDIYR